MNTTDPQRAAIIDAVIRERCTTKVLGDPARRAERIWRARHRDELNIILEGAAWAPFHKRANAAVHSRGSRTGVMPWRFHVLERTACDGLLDWLKRCAEIDPDPRWSRAWQSKISNMLAACGVLIQATWLPDPDRDSGVVDPSAPAMTQTNIEHIAAASAAIQNVLLAAEARGWKSYWSSGGILRDPAVAAQLGIAENEALLGSVFLSPELVAGASEKAGGLRDERGELGEWVRWV